MHTVVRGKGEALCKSVGQKWCSVFFILQILIFHYSEEVRLYIVGGYSTLLSVVVVVAVCIIYISALKLVINNIIFLFCYFNTQHTIPRRYFSLLSLYLPV